MIKVLLQTVPTSYCGPKESQMRTLKLSWDHDMMVHHVPLHMAVRALHKADGSSNVSLTYPSPNLPTKGLRESSLRPPGRHRIVG